MARSVICISTIALLLTGCQTAIVVVDGAERFDLFAALAPHQPVPAIDAGATYNAYGQPKSYVFDAPPQQRLASDTRSARSQHTPPWYASRLDNRAYVQAGYEGPTYQRAVSFTIDRQRMNDGRVFDNFYQSTYRESVQESVR